MNAVNTAGTYTFTLTDPANSCSSSLNVEVEDERVDTDGDGVDDCTDNCIDIQNPGQEDVNGYDDVM